MCYEIKKKKKKKKNNNNNNNKKKSAIKRLKGRSMNIITITYKCLIDKKGNFPNYEYDGMPVPAYYLNID